MRDASLGIRRRVVVQNLPPISTLLEEERERSARGHRVTPPQLEARSAKREVKREGAHAHLVERERVAELARREVGGLVRSEEHTSELQSRLHLVCRLLLEKKKRIIFITFAS